MALGQTRRTWQTQSYINPFGSVLDAFWRPKAWEMQTVRDGGLGEQSSSITPYKASIHKLAVPNRLSTGYTLWSVRPL